MEEVWKLFSGDRVIYWILITGGIFIPICFLLFYVLHPSDQFQENNVDQIATISAAGMEYPESIFFTYGLHMEAVLLLIMMRNVSYRVECVIKSCAPEDWKLDPSCICCCGLLSPCMTPESLNRANRWLVYCGVLGCFFLSLTGSILLSYQPFAHGTVAFLMFLCMVLYMFFFYFKVITTLEQLSHHIPIRGIAFLGKCARLSLYLVIGLNLLLLIIEGIVALTCNNFYCRGFVADISPSMEFLTVLSFLFFVYGFRYFLAPVVIKNDIVLEESLTVQV